MGLDLLDISFRIERSLGVKLARDDFVKHDDLGRVRGPTVGELLDSIESRLPVRGGDGELNVGLELSRSEIWVNLRTILSETLSVDPANIRLESRLVEDLGAQ